MEELHMKRKILVALLVMVLGVGASVAIYAANGGFSNEPEVVVEDCCVVDVAPLPLGDTINGGITCAGSTCRGCPIGSIVTCPFQIGEWCFCRR